jgi:DNA polymerase-3 subunit chi
MGHRIYLHCSDASQRDDLDARLWAFKGESLRAPRPCRKRTGQPDRPGLGDDCGEHQDLLVNLDLKVPAFAQRFARVAEVVVEDPVIRQAARESFRFYREQGYPLQDHRLQRL